MKLYDDGQNDEAERVLRDLCLRIGPAGMPFVAGSARRWARENPRGARPLLIAILRQKWIPPLQRRRIRRLLEVLGGRPADGT